jgi:hypothetical protein
MKLDFEKIKEVRIVEVAARYGIRFRYQGEWAKTPCPLPTHRQGDRDSNFTVNVRENYWRCFSESCNQKNSGRRGGDVINFVALKENCSEYEAAKKLAEWFNIKTAPHIEARQPRKAANGHHEDTTKSKDSPVVGKGFIQELGIWLDEFLKKTPNETEEIYFARLKKGITTRVHQSFVNGKRTAQNLPVEV